MSSVLPRVLHVLFDGLENSEAPTPPQRCEAKVEETEFEGTSLRLYLGEAQATSILTASGLDVASVTPAGSRGSVVSKPFISCEGYRAIAVSPAPGVSDIEAEQALHAQPGYSVIELIDRHVPRRKADLVLRHFAERLARNLDAQAPN